MNGLFNHVHATFLLRIFLLERSVFYSTNEKWITLQNGMGGIPFTTSQMLKGEMMKNSMWKVVYFAVLFLVVPKQAFAMHIMEGFLPLGWAIFWWALSYRLF